MSDPIEESISAPVPPPEGVSEPKPEPEAVAAPEVTPEVTTSPWLPVLERCKEVIHRTSKSGGVFRRIAAATEVIAWFEENGIFPKDVEADAASALARWNEFKKIPTQGRLTINQGVWRSAGRLIVEEENNVRNNRPLPPKTVTEAAPAEIEDELDDGMEDDDEGDDLPEDREPPSQRKQARAPAAPAPVMAPQMMAAPPQMYAQPYGYPPPGYPYPPQPQPKNKGGRPPTNPAHPNYRGPMMPQPSGVISKLIPQQMREKVRIFKRIAGGKREFLNDYTVQEINGSLEKFIHEYVDPDFGDPGAGENVYDIYEVGADDKERGQPATIAVRNRDVQQANPNDPLAQARGALELLHEVRALDDERHEQSQALLDEFKKKAVNGGDMNSMMMLMMMERFMGGNTSSNTESVVLKVLEKLSQNGQAAPILPPIAPPPMPSGPSTLDKVLEMLLAKTLAPQPQKSAMEQMTEMKMMMELMRPSAPATSPELISVLSKMNEKLDKPRGGVEEAIGHFDKIRSMVKELAPQVNAGGITGAIQSILTPELARAVGNTLANGIEKAKGPVAAAPQQAQLPAPQPAPPVQTTTTPKSDEVPKEVITAVEVFKAEKDETKARASLCNMMAAMYQLMPQQAARLDPILMEVINGNYAPARKALAEIIVSAGRPELNTEVFIDRTIAQLITNNGGTPPEALEHKAQVVRLENVAEASPNIDPAYDIPTVAESEAREKAARDAKNPTNGTEVEVTKFEKKEALSQPSSIA